jgi:hypothetical protein
VVALKMLAARAPPGVEGEGLALADRGHEPGPPRRRLGAAVRCVARPAVGVRGAGHNCLSRRLRRHHNCISRRLRRRHNCGHLGRGHN